MSKLSRQAVNGTKPYSADVTTVVDVSTNAENLVYTFVLDNALALDHYVQVFDAQSGDVVLGTTVADYVIPVKAASTGGISFGEQPLHLKTGFSIACTTTATGLTTGSSRVSITYAS